MNMKLLALILACSALIPGSSMAETKPTWAEMRTKLVNWIETQPGQIQNLENKVKENEEMDAKFMEVIHANLLDIMNNPNPILVDQIKQYIENRVQLAREKAVLEIRLKEAKELNEKLPEMLREYERDDEILRRAREARQR